ncbi:MAG: DUF2868 domain-containing protein [Deltaproteobacteria bacterium]|nr:DUF2868 domain-containing protein [Deltaproteobacteria bacterium]NND27260.1 DUF2868 domain-containing protein [Myxococcales bacterium]MBT8466307.1 DUF2868 domain-containing protein [Deltaproteobacteria bacterium]MBT8482598.1 DUF2868 domain-containing protein [Deltaproteobacteria bacterium]NNK08501.1 DUF2868 domain-containing protein [Myxococcales bacterium]
MALVTAPERHFSPGRFGLAELIDFEVQLASDRDRPLEELIARDRAIALRWQDEPKSAPELVFRWLASVQQEGAAPTLGERIARAHALANWAVFASFALLGAAVALAVLQFTGDHPINVLVVLGVFVFLQWINLAGTIVAFAWSRFSPGFLGHFPLSAFIRRLIVRLVGAEDAGRFLARRSLYAGVERWILFRALQVGAVAFNVGAIATFVAAVSFTDLAFAWSTTLQIGAEGLQRFCESLSAPWRGWLPDAVPTLDLVHATQYYRLDAAYVNAPPGARVQDAAIAGGWWPFLLMCLLVYGLLPRLLLVLWSLVGLRRALSGLPFDTPAEAEVIARLTHPRVRRVHEDDPGNTAPLGEGHQPLGRPQQLDSDRPVIAVLWREADISPEAFSARLRERFGVVVEAPIASAGGHDHSEDEALLRRLEGSEQPVMLLAEPWNAPDRAFERFVRTLRADGPPTRKIYVLLTADGDEEQRDVWAGYLAELADPYIAFGAL